MIAAFNLAEKANKMNEVPVGAVVTKNKKIIGSGSNSVIADLNVAAHAELNAIKDASIKLNNYRLNGCDIYVTLEPCHMCAKAIVDARMENIFFAAPEPKTGAIISIDNFLKREHLNHKVKFEYGFMKNKSAEILKKFFSERR